MDGGRELWQRIEVMGVVNECGILGRMLCRHLVMRLHASPPLHVCCVCRHIVKYLGFGHDEPVPTDSETQVPAPSCTYLVQEYLESGTLKSLVLKQVRGSHQLSNRGSSLRLLAP